MTDQHETSAAPDPHAEGKAALRERVIREAVECAPYAADARYGRASWDIDPAFEPMTRRALLGNREGR